MRRRSSLLLRLPLLFVSALSLLSGPANAENLRVTEPTDFWYQFDTTTTFYARTYAVDGYGSDPMLWLYNSDGQLLTQNDDWFGLQSKLEVEVPAGTYRLRAGVCCGNPNAWWQGVQYDITFNGLTVVTTTTTTSSTSTTILDTTTTTDSTTTTVEPTTTSTTVPETTTTTSTTVPETTTTTVEETTTTWATTTTSALTPIVTVTTLPETTTTTTSTTTTTTVADVVETTTTTELPTSSVETTIATLVPQERSNVLATTTTVSVPVVTRTTTTTTTEPLPPLLPVATTAVPPVTTTTLPTSEPLKAQEEAIQALTSDKEITVEALTAVLDDIQVSSLTEEQEEQLVAVLNVASEEVKKTFEDEVNVFAEGLDEYVPSGSQVPVKTRRVLIATAGLFMSMPTVPVAAAKSEVRRKQ